MDILIALGHVVGAALLLIAFDIYIEKLRNLIQKNANKKIIEETAATLCVQVSEIDEEYSQVAYKKFLHGNSKEDGGLSEKHFQYLWGRYSDNDFKNRFSDMAGTVVAIIGKIGDVIKILLALYIVFIVGEANLIWYVIPVSIVAWIAIFFIDFVCRLLTGRFPGEAKNYRQWLLSEIPATSNSAASEKMPQ